MDKSFPPEVKTPFVTSLPGVWDIRRDYRKRKAILKSPYFAHPAILVKTGIRDSARKVANWYGLPFSGEARPILLDHWIGCASPLNTLRASRAMAPA